MDGITISPAVAEEAARRVRRFAAHMLKQGALTAYGRGFVHGKFAAIDIYMPARGWVLQGIQNEINFICRRAQEAGQ